MTKLFIFDAFTLLIWKKNVAIYALLRCQIFSLKIWLCKIFDKFHVWYQTFMHNNIRVYDKIITIYYIHDKISH